MYHFNKYFAYETLKNNRVTVRINIVTVRINIYNWKINLLAVLATFNEHKRQCFVYLLFVNTLTVEGFVLIIAEYI